MLFFRKSVFVEIFWIFILRCSWNKEQRRFNQGKIFLSYHIDFRRGGEGREGSYAFDYLGSQCGLAVIALDL